VITHNAPIADIADRVLRLADGQIVGRHTNTHKRPVTELSW
jgi:putative ABC transport system ATP-binding protein